MQNSTFTCDNCETTITPEDRVIVTLTSKSVDGGRKEADLCDDCETLFMDGTLSGNDLFLQD